MMTTANYLGKVGDNQCSLASSPVVPQDINKAIVNIAEEGDWKISGTSENSLERIYSAQQGDAQLSID